MATVEVTREWANGEKLAIIVRVGESFPDVVAEAKQTAINAFAEALDITLAYDAAEDDDK